MLRFLIFLVLALSASADVTVPQRIMRPVSLEEAWNVVRLVTANVERLVREKRPQEVADQISLIGPSLRQIASHPAKDGGEAMTELQAVQAFQIVNLMAKNSMEENLDALAGSFRSLRTLLDEVASRFETSATSAEIHHCFTHTEILGRPGGSCSICGRPLQARRIPYSFVYALPDRPTLRLSLPDPVSARAGEEVRLTLLLQTMEGRPVQETDLWPMHAQMVQVMILSPGGADFQHLNASSNGKPGCFSAAFTPAFAGSYRVHVGVTPAATGLPEYPFVGLDVEGSHSPPPQEHSALMTVDSGGFRFSLNVMGQMGNQLHAGQMQALRLKITDSSGMPVTRLEPVHQAFAHLYGVLVNSGSILQLHPTGGDILREDVRGGPAFVFKIYSPEAGPLQLYAQVRIDGKDILVPLRAVIQP